MVPPGDILMVAPGFPGNTVKRVARLHHAVLGFRLSQSLALFADRRQRKGTTGGQASCEQNDAARFQAGSHQLHSDRETCVFTINLSPAGQNSPARFVPGSGLYPSAVPATVPASPARRPG